MNTLSMPSVCGENPVEQAVMNTKNAAQAGDTGGGQGTRRPQKSLVKRRRAAACFSR
jgi:hypothetical protein